MIALSTVLVSCARKPAESACPRVGIIEYADEGLVLEEPRYLDADEDLYHAIVMRVLADKNGGFQGCFSMVNLVTATPEEAVYFDCNGWNPKHAPATVVHLVATESIREKLKSDGIDAAKRVGVRRTEARIDADLANALGNVWEKMVELATLEPGFVTIMRETARDSYISACNAGCLSAVAKNPPAGSKGAQIVELGRLLAQLADARTEQRAEVLSAIDAKTRSVTRGLSKAKPAVRRLYRWELVRQGVYKERKDHDSPAEEQCN